LDKNYFAFVWVKILKMRKKNKKGSFGKRRKKISKVISKTDLAVIDYFKKLTEKL
jgi:hypothetical protein